jgi:hypothetical protein
MTKGPFPGWKSTALAQTSLRDASGDCVGHPPVNWRATFNCSLRDKATRSAWKNASDSETSSRWPLCGIFVFCTVDVVGRERSRRDRGQ